MTGRGGSVTADLNADIGPITTTGLKNSPHPTTFLNAAGYSTFATA
jgi:hypothetical protein